MLSDFFIFSQTVKNF